MKANISWKSQAMQEILDTIESAVTLSGKEVFGSEMPNSLTILGDEDSGVNYRVTIKEIAK